MGDHREPEEELHQQDRHDGMRGERGGDLAPVRPEQDGPAGAEHGDEPEPHRHEGGEEQEGPVVVDALEEGVSPTARHGELLEGLERRLGRPHRRVAPVSRQHLPQAGGRAHRQEPSAAELGDEARDDVEVEGAVAQHVGGPHLLERGPPVHLVPEELLRLRELDVALGLPVLQHIGGGLAHPGAELGELALLERDALGAVLEVGEPALDLLDPELLAPLGADEELDPGLGLGLPGALRRAHPATPARYARRPGPWPRGPSG